MLKQVKLVNVVEDCGREYQMGLSHALQYLRDMGITAEVHLPTGEVIVVNRGKQGATRLYDFTKYSRNEVNERSPGGVVPSA
jgi:hypothetical protein